MHGKGETGGDRRAKGKKGEDHIITVGRGRGGEDGRGCKRQDKGALPEWGGWWGWAPGVLFVVAPAPRAAKRTRRGRARRFVLFHRQRSVSLCVVMGDGGKPPTEMRERERGGDSPGRRRVSSVFYGWREASVCKGQGEGKTRRARGGLKGVNMPPPPTPALCSEGEERHGGVEREGRDETKTRKKRGASGPGRLRAPCCCWLLTSRAQRRRR